MQICETKQARKNWYKSMNVNDKLMAFEKKCQSVHTSSIINQNIHRFFSIMKTKPKKNKSNPKPLPPKNAMINNDNTAYSKFMTEYNNRRKLSINTYHNNNNQPYSLKRAVFISIVGLHQSWKNIPIYVLHNCICILPIKLNSVLASKSNDCIIDTAFADTILNDTEFMNFLRFKSAQNMLFCLQDYHDKSSQKLNFKLHSFWTDISQHLTRHLYDPMNPEMNYNPLHLDAFYWKKRWNMVSGDNYGIGFAEIMDEINKLTMHLRCMKLILEESNPSLMVFVFGYHDCASDDDKVNKIMTNEGGLCTHECDDVILSDDWWVSDEYFF